MVSGAGYATAVDKADLGVLAGRVPAALMQQVDAGLRRVLEL
jgi:mRNA-degrading endonuclease toxin of MazEF toxin-antitoxin module